MRGITLSEVIPQGKLNTACSRFYVEAKKVGFKEEHRKVIGREQGGDKRRLDKDYRLPKQPGRGVRAGGPQQSAESAVHSKLLFYEELEETISQSPNIKKR